MERSGRAWLPLLLVNPVQVKALQGRKSDQRDAKRIAEFLKDGRLDGSFVPPREIRELRQMLRHRQSLLEQRNEVHNQIRDLLETGNFKLSSVATDLMGLTGRNSPARFGQWSGLAGTLELEGARIVAQERSPDQGSDEGPGERVLPLDAEVPSGAI